MKVGTYLRVSTDGQTVENQRQQLQNFAKSQDWTIVAEFSDTATGSNGNRVGFKQMLDAVARHQFDLLLVFAVDRISREGAAKVFSYITQLTAGGVKFHSFTEPHLSTAGPFADVVLAMYSTFARLEREKLIERTKAGLERARREGKYPGRPRARIDRIAVDRRRREGASLRQIAKEQGVGLATIHAVFGKGHQFVSGK